MSTPAPDLIGPATGLPGTGHAAAALRGGSWLAVAQALRAVMQVVVIVVLANLLVPEDYGLVAVVFVVLGLGFVFAELGLTAAVVQKPDLTDEDLCSAFWLNAAAGLVLTVVVAASAPLLAAAYDEPRLVPLVLVASSTFTLSLGVVHVALLERAGRFRAIAVVELVATVAGWAVTVGCAAAGAGAVSLLLGPLGQTVLGTVLMWRAARWLPRHLGTRAGYAHAWRFGRGLAGYNLIAWASASVDTIVVSRVGGAAALGLYNRAYNLTRLPVEQAYWLLDRVLLPVFSRLQHDPPRLRAGVERSMAFACLLLVPGLLGIAAVAQPLTDGLLGPEWADMVPLLQLLALASVPQVVLSVLRTVFTAAGRTQELFRWGLVQNGATVLAVLVGAAWGVTGVAAALALRGWVGLPWAVRAPLRLLDAPTRLALVPLARVLAPAAVMVAGVLGLEVALGERDPVVRLVLELLAGVVLYTTAVVLLARRSLVDARALLRPGASQAPG